MKKIMGIFVFFALVLVAAPASAGDLEHWGEYAIQKKINDRWSIRSDVQLRFNEDISDLYWYRWEIGPNFKVDNRWLNVQTYFRMKRQESAGRWNNQYNIFIDPIVKLYNNQTTTLDFRVRIHTQLNDDNRRQFIRLRPRLTTRFMLGKTRCAWFTYNDFWLQYSELGARDRYNTNWLGTGIRFGINKPLDFSLYFQYRSDKLPATGKWDHDPVLGTGLQYNF